LEITTVVRKKDIFISAALIALCLAGSAGLYVVWPSALRNRLKDTNRRLREEQGRLARCLEAASKLDDLSRGTESKREEIESYESRFPPAKRLLALQREIYDTAETGGVKVKQLKKKDPVASETGFVEAVYTMETISSYSDLLKFMTHFESKRSPIYFTRVQIEPLSDDASDMKANLQMVAYGIESKEHKR